ncbi:nucleotidyltransferase family protein [Aquimarina sp. ERC-38]|uniref:nucleotidyltransferase family protein n=1 Tax=Aquimarina sp. ERC-38 TaxID=2949996 RepID=UPI0022478889|nr:nucleotidyltransferase family protein [Aquimarina sp. ERC-38]UZO81035.1 nucleotidyltransferase family protein [Aquimarina sp. ERC-38]
MSETIIGIVLAAGSSSRMGQAKQLLPLQNTTLLEYCLTNMQKSKVSKVICVLGANAEEIQRSVKDERTAFLINSEWENGMSSSIVAAINYIKGHEPSCNAALIALADQPGIDSDYFNRLMEMYQSNPEDIIASQYQNKIGVPALFSNQYFKDLLQLTGDKGARNFLNDGQQKIRTLANTSNLSDLDTPEQYQAYLKSIRKESSL